MGEEEPGYLVSSGPSGELVDLVLGPRRITVSRI